MVDETNYDLRPAREGGTHLSMSQAADAMSGMDLLGEGPELEKPVEPEQEPEVDEVDESPAEAEPQQDVDEEEAAPEAEEEQAPIESLQQLAEALEVDNDQLSDLKVTFKANGEDQTVTLSELQRGYQRQAGVTQKIEQLESQHNEQTEVVKKQSQKFEQDTVQLGNMLQQAKNILLGEINTAEMQSLRSTNPAEWAARSHEMQARATGIDQLYNSASQQYQRFVDEQSAGKAQATQEQRTKELAKLQEALPDWGDGLRNDIVSYLASTYSFSNDDLSNVMDSRLIQLANKARLYDQMEKVGVRTKKKVEALPKTMTAKKGVPKKSANQMNYAKAKKRLASTGKTRDAAELIGYLKGI